MRNPHTKFEADPARHLSPTPPPGYAAPVRFHYPAVKLVILNLVVVVLAVPLVGALVLWIHGAPESASFTIRMIDISIDEMWICLPQSSTPDGCGAR